MKGDTGAAGAAGATGSTGATGATGAAGGRFQIDLRPLTGSAAAWTNMPLAETDFLGVASTYRKVLDLQSATSARLLCNQTIAGATAATLKAQYSIDGTTWSDLCSVATGAGTGMKTGAWSAVPSPAKIDACHIRLRGLGGDGVVDPAWHWVGLEIR